MGGGHQDTCPPRLPRIGPNKCPERSKNHIRKKDEKERKKSIKSGLKTRLERFKNQKFSNPGEGDTPSPGPNPLHRGPTGLGQGGQTFFLEKCSEAL